MATTRPISKSFAIANASLRVVFFKSPMCLQYLAPDIFISEIRQHVLYEASKPTQGRAFRDPHSPVLLLA
ncbi:hypothetical protein PC39_15232 [Salinisphaera sp. PC39]